MVLIQWKFYNTWISFCGGTIISDRTILTAAHCLEFDSKKENYQIFAGIHTINNPIENQIYTPIEFVLHPSFIYNKVYDTYDMTIIVVDRSIEFSPIVKPICLPMEIDDELFWNHKAIAAGWGETNRTEAITTLMETKVRVLPSEICNSELSAVGVKYNEKAMMCAHEDFTGSCQGDSGGPLFGIYDRSYFIILGVTSFGKGCASEVPEVYAKVSDQQTLKWIHAVINNFGGNVCETPNIAMNYR